MPICAAFGCANQMGKVDKSISFHRFPGAKKEEIQLQWIRNVSRKGWRPSVRSVLCSKHFEESCFQRNEVRPRLKDGAIPTIFTGMPDKMQQEIATR